MSKAGAGAERNELDLLPADLGKAGPCPRIPKRAPQMSKILNRGDPTIALHVGNELRHERIRSLSPTERWARIALKLLVADSPYRPVLCISPGLPFTDSQIANQLMVSPALWKRLKRKMVDWGEIETDKSVGLKYAGWRGFSGSKVSEMMTVANPDELMPLDEETLKKHEDTRRWLIERYNLISGLNYGISDRQLIQCVEGRMAEGATPEDLDIGMRTYLWVYLNASPAAYKKAIPFRAFKAHSFWKWVKMNMPAPLIKLDSTSGYLSSLPWSLRKRGYSFCKDYIKEVGLMIRRNGWDNLYDVDFTKVKTCKQYVMEKMEKEK